MYYRHTTHRMSVSVMCARLRNRHFPERFLIMKIKKLLVSSSFGVFITLITFMGIGCARGQFLIGTHASGSGSCGYSYSSETVVTPERRWTSPCLQPVGQSRLPDMPANHYRRVSGPGYDSVSETRSDQYGYRAVGYDGRQAVVVTTTTWSSQSSSTYPVWPSVPIVEVLGTARAGTVYGNPLGLRVVQGLTQQPKRRR